MIRFTDGGGDGGGASTTSTSTDVDGGDSAATSIDNDPKPLGKPAPQAREQEATKSKDGLPDDVDSLQKMIADLRKENASSRTNAKTKAAEDARNDVTQAIGKALGLIKDGDDTPSAEALAQQATAAQSQAKAAAIELAVFRTAKDHGGDPVALTDSRAFLAKVADLDPTAEDFTTKVTAAAKAAVAANASLKPAQVAGQSTIEHPGGSGERSTPPKNLNEAVANAYSSN
jgi:hypothetical protein